MTEAGYPPPASVIKVPYVVTMPAPIKVICQAPPERASVSAVSLKNGQGSRTPANADGATKNSIPTPSAKNHAQATLESTPLLQVDEAPPERTPTPVSSLENGRSSATQDGEDGATNSTTGLLAFNAVDMSPEPLSSVAHIELEAGLRMRCVGLVDCAELNGTCCVLKYFDGETGGWTAELESDGTMWNLKPQNLEHLAAKHVKERRSACPRSHRDGSEVAQGRIDDSCTTRVPSPPTRRPSTPTVPPQTTMDGISTTSASSTASGRSEGARFWKPAVKRLYEVYLERRHQDLLDIFLRLDVLHWRQLLEFLNAFRGFLYHAPHAELPAPPALPKDVLVYIMTSYLTGQSVPPVVSELCEPRWYLQAMVLLRLLMGSGAPRSSENRSPGLPTPPLVVQFLIHTLSSSAASAFLFTAGAQGREAAWDRHGGDLLLAMQHVILRLYPDEAGAFLDGPRQPVQSHEVPSFSNLCLCAALHFSSHLLIPNSPPEADEWWNISCIGENDLEANEMSSASSSSQFSNVLRCLSLLSRASAATKKIGDRFVLCLGDTLRQFLGPAPKRSQDLPEPAAPMAPTSEATPSVVDMKNVGRIVRTILHAHNIDRARLAAREEGRRAMQNNGVASEDGSMTVDVLAAGSFAGPSEPGDFVPIMEQGPLRRSLAFMEQSALLHMVQSKLCAAHFADVVGATEQLSMFALRNINVLWFDLRRCTSTLKQDTMFRSEESARSAPGGASAMLVLRNLRLGLAPDWEAKLAKFPYLHLAGSSRVSVKSLVISIRFSVSHGNGVGLKSVDVGIPELDIQLICMSTLSQIILSLVLTILRDTMKEHIQSQLHKHLLQLLRSEFEKFNYSVWRFIVSVVPERLVNQSLNWFGSSIPPEGLPI